MTDPIDLEALRLTDAELQSLSGHCCYPDGILDRVIAELTTRRARDADVVKLVEKGARLIGAFKSLGQADDIVTDHRTRRECEQAIVAFDAELAYFQRSDDKGDAT